MLLDKIQMRSHDRFLNQLDIIFHEPIFIKIDLNIYMNNDIYTWERF